MQTTKKINILAKYPNIANVFSKKLAKMLAKQISINEHTIKLVKNKQPVYRPIYSLSQVELEIWKTYIEINLANGFIWLLKSFFGAFIFFV